MAMCSECNTGPKLTIRKVTRYQRCWVRVRAYTDAIIGGDVITMEKLLLAPTFDIEYDEFHVVKTIHRQTLSWFYMYVSCVCKCCGKLNMIIILKASLYWKRLGQARIVQKRIDRDRC